MTILDELEQRLSKEAKKDRPTRWTVKVRDFMCQNFYRYPHLWRRDDHLCEGQPELRAGARPGAAKLCALAWTRSCRRRSPLPAWLSPPKRTPRKRARKWGANTLCPMRCTAAEGYVSANLARKVTGFSEEDLALLWQAILNMFENDRSAARGKDGRAQAYRLPPRFRARLRARAQAVRAGACAPRGKMC